jgi:hypothetical protein
LRPTPATSLCNAEVAYSTAPKIQPDIFVGGSGEVRLVTNHGASDYQLFIIIASANVVDIRDLVIVGISRPDEHKLPVAVIVNINRRNDRLPRNSVPTEFGLVASDVD